MIKPIADDLYQLRGLTGNLINVYWASGILIDAGTSYSAGRLLRQLRRLGKPVEGHLLTHAHPDHQGSSHAICAALGLPLWCGRADAEAVENPRLILDRLPAHFMNRLIGPYWLGPAHPVGRRLAEGDEVAGFTVLEVPGHTAGQIALWRERDRVLICGDVIANMHAFSGIPGLHEPPAMFSIDPVANRHSARRLAALAPAVVCFGHGPPLRDTQRFVQFIERLPNP